MIIVLLLFFKSICLYCQHLVLHIHDRWINPKNVRLLKEAAEAKGSKFEIEEFRKVKNSKKRRYVSNSSTSGHSSTSPLSNCLTDSDSCRFCANTPQGYCRHHFHLQELHVQKQQRQQKFWCPLSGVIAGTNRSTEYRQLRKIKRELKRNIQQQQQLKSARASTILYDHFTNSNNTSNKRPSPPSSSYQSVGEYSSYFVTDSRYQTSSLNTESAEDSIQRQPQSDSATVINSSKSSHDYADIELPSPPSSFAETTYSFETCYETPHRSPPSQPKTTANHSFASGEYSALSTSYL